MDGQPDSSGPHGRDASPPGSPCILLAASLQGECADTGASAGARTPPGRLCSPRILHLFCFSRARMGTRCTLSTSSSLQPPTEVPYVSVMNRHEAWGRGSGNCQSLVAEWTRELPGQCGQSHRAWWVRVWAAVLSGHPQHPEGLSQSTARSPKVQAVVAQRHQSPPSLWLVVPAEGLMPFIRDDYLPLPNTCLAIRRQGQACTCQSKGGTQI